MQNNQVFKKGFRTAGKGFCGFVRSNGCFPDFSDYSSLLVLASLKQDAELSEMPISGFEEGRFFHRADGAFGGWSGCFSCGGGGRLVCCTKDAESPSSSSESKRARFVMFFFPKKKCGFLE